MAKKRKASGSQASRLPWCWYCDREFEDEKVLIVHQKAKHFKCHYCHKKLNSPSGLVIHLAQLHKETITKVPNAIPEHDTPEVEIFGMDGVPPDDLARHYDGLPVVPYKRLKISEGGLLPLLAAQKANIPSEMELGASPNLGAGFGLSGSLGNVRVPPGIMAAPSMSFGVTAPVLASPPMPVMPASPPPPAASYPYPVPPVPPLTSNSPFNAAIPTVPTPSLAFMSGGAVTSFPLDVPEASCKLVNPPSTDPVTGKLIPGSIIIAPDIDLSMEEKRAALPRYQYSCS